LKGFEGEWREIKLKDCFRFVKSYSVSREGLSKNQGNHYCIHYGDIHAFYETEFLDFKNQNNIPRIIDEKTSIQKIDCLKEGDVIMADASEDYKGVGETVVVLNIENKIAVGGLHTIVLRDFTGKTYANYRAYLFASEKVRNELRKKATGTSVYSVTKTTLESLMLNLSSIEEQIAIARVLQAADEEIQLLKSKAGKLKEQKKGLMQVLLTEKKRLMI
jgi:type I restriction enzyme S subunit